MMVIIIILILIANICREFMMCFVKDFEGISSFHFLIMLTQVLLLSLYYSSGT